MLLLVLVIDLPFFVTLHSLGILFDLEYLHIQYSLVPGSVWHPYFLAFMPQGVTSYYHRL